MASISNKEASPDRPQLTVVAKGGRSRPRVLLIAALAAFVIGLGSIGGGVAGAVYTYNQAATENVVTPDDASIPGAEVRGPFTMKAQVDIIREHTLERTGGLYYAEMPRTVEQVDDNGNVVLDENGEPATVPNTARELWLTATGLTTALNLGIMAYALAAFAIVVGLALVVNGVVFLSLRKSSLSTA
jgi:hypothetical protein